MNPELDEPCLTRGRKGAPSLTPCRAERHGVGRALK